MNEFLITLEDKPGSLAECCEALGKAGINIITGAGLGSSVAAAALVTEESSETAAALEAIGVSFTMKDLHTATINHSPRSLGNFTRSLAEKGVNLGSIYVIRTSDEGVVIGYSTD